MTAPAVPMSPPAVPVHRPPRFAGTFGALLARDLRVMRRGIVSIAARTVVQPVLFIFVFAVVLPRIGGVGAQPNAATFSTILVPGLVASSLVMQGIFAVTTPLVMELSYTREIDDRALAPIPVWALGVQKIISGAFESLIAALIVFPAVLFVHTPGTAPDIDFSRWPLLILVLLLSTTLTACLGLLIGTLLPPHQLSTLFAIFIVPLMMFGCVYYPWAGLDPIPWLKYGVLINPLVYVSEALRGALSPGIPHMPVPTVLAVLAIATLVTGTLAMRTFRKRLVT